jgi:hypothetical protein
MRRNRLLLALAAGLFTAWIAYLAFLALTKSHIDVLSHPQFLVADLWVIADVDGLDKPISVVEVVYARPGLKDGAPEKGKTIDLSNLSMCQESWKGPGRYIVPLSHPRNEYYVTPIPRSPGYPPDKDKMTLPQVRIYPDTPDTRAQLARLPQPKPPEAN